MTDLEAYVYWAETYDALYRRVAIGAISGDDADRIVANMESRLGMNNWSDDQWRDAYDAWLSQGEVL